MSRQEERAFSAICLYVLIVFLILIHLFACMFLKYEYSFSPLLHTRLFLIILPTFWNPLSSFFLSTIIFYLDSGLLPSSSCLPSCSPFHPPHPGAKVIFLKLKSAYLSLFKIIQQFLIPLIKSLNASPWFTRPCITWILLTFLASFYPSSFPYSQTVPTILHFLPCFLSP